MSKDAEGDIVCDSCGIIAEYPAAELEEAGWYICPADDAAVPALCPACEEKAMQRLYEWVMGRSEL